MTHKRDIFPRDFSNVRSWPGTAGNPFDVVLQSKTFFDRIPAPVILLILIAIALLGGKFRLANTTLLISFFFFDLICLYMLHQYDLSFGPIKPVLLTLALLRAPFALLPYWWAVGFQIVGTLLILYGFFIEPFRLDVHTEQMTSEKLGTWDSLKIAHLGDMHIERITRREKAILHALEAAKPDLILFSGDILNLSCVYDPQAQEEAADFLRSLHAPLGVFGVTGSPPVDPPEVYDAVISSSPLQRLDNRCVQITFGESKLSITGLTCSHHPEEDYLSLQGSGLDQPDSHSFNIFLYHSPDLAPLVQNSGFDLQLSGHTHGGQVRLPLYGAIFAASLYHKAFEAGRYLLGQITLYVTRGLGMEGGIAPRVRFLCRPELIIWEISGEKASSVSK